MRGIERETFLHLLESSANLQLLPQSKKTRANPLSEDLNSFWNGEELSDNFTVAHLAIPKNTGVLLSSLGKFPFWRGKNSMENILHPLYLKSSKRVLDQMIDD